MKTNPQYDALSKEHPHLKIFAEITFPERFKNPTKQTACDVLTCGKKLRANQINIFVTPEPDLKPLVVCHACLHNLNNRYAGSGIYGH